ncbi:MAG TPA: FAD/NAD(P)-binding oxidoreductase [Gaiellaceae bacterium]
MTWAGKPLNVVIAGAGVAGLEAALALQKLAPDDVSVQLVAPETEFVYRPLAVAEPFRVAELRRFPLQVLCDAAGARLRRGSVAAVDPEQKTLALTDGDELAYDALLLALGAKPREAVEGAITFSGPDTGELAALLERVVDGDVSRVAFAVPSGSMWPLPLYELALLTAAYASDHGSRGLEVSIVTPEERPLAIFGPAASDAVRELLGLRGIGLEPSTAPVRFADGRLEVLPSRAIPFDAVVALPRLEGPRLEGIPHDESGFVPTDGYGAVRGLTDVYAAGDLTQFPLKQGGSAAQQADAVASAIAADAGADVRPEPFTPVLRGLLLTGFVPRFLRAGPTGAQSVVDTEPLWWPPAKIVGAHLAPFLAAQLGLPEAPKARDGVEVEIALA